MALLNSEQDSSLRAKRSNLPVRGKHTEVWGLLRFARNDDDASGLHYRCYLY